MLLRSNRANCRKNKEFSIICCYRAFGFHGLKKLSLKGIGTFTKYFQDTNQHYGRQIYPRREPPDTNSGIRRFPTRVDLMLTIGG